MAAGSNFYKVLITRFSNQQHKLLFCISLIYGLACTTHIAIPILFKEAHLDCGDPEVTPTLVQSCYEEDVCSTKVPFIIDKKTGPKSLSTQFELICEGRSEQRKSLSIIFGVSLLAVFFNILTILKPLWRKSFYSFCGIIIGASQLFAVYFSNNLMVISFFLGLASMGYILILTYSFLLINDFFEDDTAKVSFGVMNITWGILGVVYALIGMMTNADWKSLNIITGIPIIISSIVLNMIDEDTEADFIVPHSSERLIEIKDNNWSLMKEAFKSQAIRKNFLIFLFYWFAQVITYIGLPIEVESIGGNLYINLAVFALTELVGSFIASELSLKYEFLDLFKWFLNITIILFLFFFLVPSNLQSQNSLIITCFVIDSYAVKLAYDTSWHLIGMYLPNLFTPRFYGQYLIVAVCISRFSLIFLPYMNFLVRNLGFHPFALYGVLWLISRVLIRNAEMLYLRNKPEMQAIFEMRSGVVNSEGKFQEVDCGERLLIKRENKLRKKVALQENLLSETEIKVQKPPDYIPNIDCVYGEGRRTLVFEGLKLPEVGHLEARKKDSTESMDERKNLPIIGRKNVKGGFKRQMSQLGVSEIIRIENPLDEMKKQLYGEESPILKEIRRDTIHEEGELGESSRG